MSPSRITLDLTSDFDASTAGPQTNGKGVGAGNQRTLLLAPPSISAHEEKLRDAFAEFDRAATDLQMLDRLSAGLVTLPPSTYDLVLVLTDADGSRRAEAVSLLASRDVLARLVPALRPGGKLRSEDGYLGSAAAGSAEAKEAILAGLVAGDDGFVKPDEEEVAAVPLRFGAKKKNNNLAANGTNGTAAAVPVAKPQTLDPAPPAPKIAGVGFVDFSDDFGDYDEDDDDELIDEDTLLGEDDLRRPIQQPAECKPKPGQKRKACKDCTCGLAERLEAKDKARREKADQGLAALKLASEDLNELDFTVKGKTGSCNSCSLGDAFRCEGCPYIGLPPFKPGEEVMILNNVAQF